MLHLILGRTGSRKSLYAEQLIAECSGPTLYVGTLPDSHDYRHTITQHQVRRPHSWDLLEMIGSPEFDLRVLSSRIENYDNIIIDGLAFYLVRVLAVFDGNFTNEWVMARALIRRLAGGTVYTLVVDTILDQSFTQREMRAIRLVQGVLAKHCVKIELVTDGVPAEITDWKAISAPLFGVGIEADQRVTRVRGGGA